jgi:catechol 2,3-dioxygenase-like lactoylglutathione lyase family enzyme
MPRLNHTNLPVAEVAPLRDFFVTHFGFTPIHEPAGSPMAVLRGEDGFILNVMQKRASDAGAFPGDFHVGFLFETPDEVHAIHDRLAAAGVRTGEVERMTRRGITSTTFYCFAPNEIMVEVSCYVTDALDVSRE